MLAPIVDIGQRRLPDRRVTGRSSLSATVDIVLRVNLPFGTI